ncbi:MAG: M20/M25/M40 family metallo-hydrolase [Chloroflexi bacterium]|nr:M20/M25/M40 family metallo-hydrolase [Chloroflexota bacterium]
MALLTLLLISALFPSVQISKDSSALRAGITAANIRTHLVAFQTIADNNGNNRAAGTPGHQASADYVANKLQSAGYIVTRQSFQFPYFQELAPPVLERTSPNPRSFTVGTDMRAMGYSGSGDVTAQLQTTPDIIIPSSAASTTSTSGCEASDFAGFIAGRIALIQRGTCTFRQKVVNAQNAGAAGVIIFNEGKPGRADVVRGMIGEPGINIPVVGASFAVGEELYRLMQSGAVTLHLTTSTSTEFRTTENIIGETPGGRDDRVVIVGGHLDSVPEGPGLNDNASGSAAILEIALQISNLKIDPRNKMRFAFWGAEEEGLLGSRYYVDQLDARGIQNIAVVLNFDMIASPNYKRFVYDGNGSDTRTSGPPGSGEVEKIFLDYFDSVGLATEPTALDGSSDYDPFIDVGIPAGGLFSGAGQGLDNCYHMPCDDINNINDQALDELSDAAAHAVWEFAMTTSTVNDPTPTPTVTPRR